MPRGIPGSGKAALKNKTKSKAKSKTGAKRGAAAKKPGRKAVAKVRIRRPGDDPGQNTEAFGGGQTLHVGSDERKLIPIATGVIDYFPDALVEVARVSQIGNEKHNPGEPLHWSRGKGGNNSDELMRHFIERDKMDSDTTLHAAKVAWRALAYLQLAIEARRAKAASECRSKTKSKSSAESRKER